MVRVALGRAITQQWFPGNEEVQVIESGYRAGHFAASGIAGRRRCELGGGSPAGANARRFLAEEMLARRRYYWLTMRYVHYCPAFAAQFYATGGVVRHELFR